MRVRDKTRLSLRATRQVGKSSRLSVSALRVVALLASTVSASRLLARPADVPVIDGNLGPCTADFIVTDSSDKPVRSIKIHVTIVSGFMNKRKSELEIGTNGDGKACFEGLPAEGKKPPLELTAISMVGRWRLASFCSGPICIRHPQLNAGSRSCPKPRRVAARRTSSVAHPK